VSILSLNLVREFHSVTILNLGGGYKVGRMSSEKSTDLQLVGEPVREAFQRFAEETGRKIKLEIEPGTFLVANAGVLLSTVQDIVSTGSNGYTFIKLDSGMTDVLRPSL
jgi:diaminopimelate decarboxylase